MESYLSVVVDDRPDAAMVTLRGELDMASSPQLHHAIERAESGPDRPIVIDLADVEFMDVTGLRVLLGAHERATRRGIALRLVNVGGGVRRLFTVTGSTELLRELESGRDLADQA